MNFTRLDEKSLKRLAEYLTEKKEESGIGDCFRVIGIETEYGITEPTEYQSEFYKYIEQSGEMLGVYSDICHDYFDNEENEKYEKEMRMKYGIKL